MQRDKFPAGVDAKLKRYVYRLIDPRNGETFYVGKGQGNRIFQHVKSALAEKDAFVVMSDEDSNDLKFSRIRAISRAGLEVGYVIHRHGIENEDSAYQIEAALIDAYPGLTNKVSGHDSGDFGCKHVEEIIAHYDAKPFEVKEPLILISITKSYEEEGRDPYQAVRGVWRISEKNARDYNLVLAHTQGIVVGAYRPEKWVRATRNNFPWLTDDIPDRIGFVGHQTEPEIWNYYVGRRVPDEYRRKGAANPVRFVPRTSAMHEPIASTPN